MYRLKEVGKEPSDWRFSNAKHGKGSVSHQWKISWHFRMHLLHANLWFQRKMTPDERDVLWDPAGRWGEWTPGPLKRGQWCQPSANVQPQQHPVVRSGHHTSSGKGVLTATTDTASTQMKLRSSRASSSFSFSPTPPGRVWAGRDTDRQEGRQIRVFYTDLCQRWCVLCVSPCLGFTDLTVSSQSASSTSNLYWLTSDDFADTLQSTSHVLISPSLSLELWVPHHICFSLISETISVRGLILRGATAASACAATMFNMEVEPLHAGAHFHHRITTGALAQLPLSDQSKQLLRSHFHTH